MQTAAGSVTAQTPNRNARAVLAELQMLLLSSSNDGGGNGGLLTAQDAVRYDD